MGYCRFKMTVSPFVTGNVLAELGCRKAFFRTDESVSKSSPFTDPLVRCTYHGPRERCIMAGFIPFSGSNGS